MNDILDFIFSKFIFILGIIIIIYNICRYFYEPPAVSWIGKIFAVIFILIIGSFIGCGGLFLILSGINIFKGPLLIFISLCIVGAIKLIYATIKYKEGDIWITMQGIISNTGGAILWIVLYSLFEIFNIFDHPITSSIISISIVILIKKIYDYRHALISFLTDKSEPVSQSLEISFVSALKLRNQETTELMTSLSQVDISNIASVTFIPTDGQGFTIKTPNIKRLSVYITTKLKKNIFEGEELRKAFDHVVHHISSDLSKTDFNLVQGKINEFVKSGGEVKVNKI